MRAAWMQHYWKLVDAATGLLDAVGATYIGCSTLVLGTGILLLDYAYPRYGTTIWSWS